MPIPSYNDPLVSYSDPLVAYVPVLDSPALDSIPSYWRGAGSSSGEEEYRKKKRKTFTSLAVKAEPISKEVSYESYPHEIRFAGEGSDLEVRAAILSGVPSPWKEPLSVQALPEGETYEDPEAEPLGLFYEDLDVSCVWDTMTEVKVEASAILERNQSFNLDCQPIGLTSEVVDKSLKTLNALLITGEPHGK